MTTSNTLYEGDLGQWKHGRIELVRANSPEDAYNQLIEMLVDDEEVVQIREHKHGNCVYDYMNGFSLYR